MSSFLLLTTSIYIICGILPLGPYAKGILSSVVLFVCPSICPSVLLLFM